MAEALRFGVLSGRQLGGWWAATARGAVMGLHDGTSGLSYGIANQATNRRTVEAVSCKEGTKIGSRCTNASYAQKNTAVARAIAVHASIVSPTERLAGSG